MRTIRSGRRGEGALIGIAVALGLFAAAAAEGVPEIADRYQVNGYASDQEPKPNPAVFSEKTPFDEVRRIMLNDAESEERRALAADFWNSQVSAVYYNPRPEFWSGVDISFDLLDRLFELPPGSKSRRHSITVIFGNLSAQVRGAVIDRPGDPQWRSHWTRAHGFVTRGLADGDPRLREFFERYVPLPASPDWKTDKARLRKIFARARAEDPGERAIIDRIWNTMQEIETAQLGFKTKYDAQIRAAKLDARAQRRLLRYQAHITDYRLSTVWSNQGAWMLREVIGPQKTADLRLVVEPVRNGWPEY